MGLLHFFAPLLALLAFSSSSHAARVMYTSCPNVVPQSAHFLSGLKMIVSAWSNDISQIKASAISHCGQSKYTAVFIGGAPGSGRVRNTFGGTVPDPQSGNGTEVSVGSMHPLPQCGRRMICTRMARTGPVTRRATPGGLLSCLPDPPVAGHAITPLGTGGTCLLIIIFTGGDLAAAFFAFDRVPLQGRPQLHWYILSLQAAQYRFVFPRPRLPAEV